MNFEQTARKIIKPTKKITNEGANRVETPKTVFKMTKKHHKEQIKRYRQMIKRHKLMIKQASLAYKLTK